MKYVTTLAALLLGSVAMAAAEDIRFADWDTNGDGSLSRDEAAEIQYHMFDTFDLDEDGDLKGREREAFEATLSFRHNENPVIATMGSPDANGDGLISAGEFKRWTSSMFDRLDLSGDGALSEQEMMAKRP